MISSGQVESIRRRIDSKLEVFYKGKHIQKYEIETNEDALVYFLYYDGGGLAYVCEMDIDPWEITIPLFKN